jgi:hypothetical protein
MLASIVAVGGENRTEISLAQSDRNRFAREAVRYFSIMGSSLLSFTVPKSLFYEIISHNQLILGSCPRTVDFFKTAKEIA